MSSSDTLSKGAQTRENIILAGYDLARRVGLDGLTIGSIAAAVGMSKSGLFAHFGAREDLQLAVLAHAADEVGQAVFAPAFRQPRGLARLRAVIRAWLDFVGGLNRGGCLVLGAVSEFDDKPGPVRDQLVRYQSELRQQIMRTVQMAIDSGEFSQQAEPAQVAFELYSMLLGLHHDLRLFNDRGAIERTDKAVNQILERYATQPLY